MCPQGQSRDERLAELADAAEILNDGIRELNKDTGGQLVFLSRRAKINRVMISALGFLFLLNAALTGFVINLSNQVNEGLGDTRNKILCPLYQQFLNSDTPKQRELAEKFGQDMEVRREAFRVINEGYGLLNCKGVTEK